MNVSQIAGRAGLVCLFLMAPLVMPARASKLTVPPETAATLDKIYSFDLEGAVEDAKRMEEQRPNHPLGYLLEAEALWRRLWSTSTDSKYRLHDAPPRPKFVADHDY